MNSSPPIRARKAPRPPPAAAAPPPQQLVPNRVAKNVVDLLEAVEIEAQNGEALPRERARATVAARCSENAARFGRSVNGS